ncbi:MAG: peptidoglycan bridge formation glycyltransferase FemA/FemB family protein [Patescibacteria group bacterium]|nr:peptidoglycan bridge formation glycyltransferase FemA/FemB family protein [Patescibacteria group bacterium]
MQQENSLNRVSDLRQSVEYGKYMESLGWTVDGGIFIKKLPLVPFYFAKYQRPNCPINTKKLIGLIKKYRVILFIIEPNLPSGSVLEGLGGFKKSEPMLPSKTIWLDLKKSQSKLLNEMHKKTRYNIKKHQVKVEVVRGDKLSRAQFNSFYNIYKKNSQRQKFWGSSEKELRNLIKSFSKKAYLLLSREGGLLLLIYDGVAYYSHNASSVRGKKKFLPTGLTWRAIKLAKKLGCKRFDFEGIRDKRYSITKKWKGFSRFKKGFGGTEVEYVGAFRKLGALNIFGKAIGITV